MNDHTLAVLEYEKVIALLRSLAFSNLGRQRVDNLRPRTDPTQIRYELAETTEMRRLWEAKQDPPLDGLHDLSGPLKKAGIGGAMLEPPEFLQIKDCAVAARRIQSALREIRVKAPHIQHYGQRLIPREDIEEAIDRVLDEMGEVRDSASPELRKIRRSLRELRQEIVKKLEILLRTEFKPYVMENYYTQREGRYVLPVEAKFQNRVAGIIHDRSATGTTVYIEPLALIQEGNRLKDLEKQQELEVRRILRELTDLVGKAAPDLESNQEIFADLDFLAAKARFSIRFDMTEPELVENGPFELLGAKHPLLMKHLGAERVVRQDIRLDRDIRILVITGPNTGGKTVVLKTVGLLILMAQSGLHIPAQFGTRIPVFRYVGADIGDEQSLEQSLSTFSSHISQIRKILEEAGPGSLILLDELGSGTDPVEGGALATAILESLHQKGVMALITTHLNDLKVYAHNAEGVTNGAMEFDSDTLEPTFRFTLGLPGRSNAIQIAQRLGLSSEIIQSARGYVGESGAEAEDLLFRLGEELKMAQQHRWDAEEALRKARDVERESTEQLRRANSEAGQILRRSERKAQGLLTEMERRLKALDRQEQEFRQEWKRRLAELEQKALSNAPPETLLQQLRQELRVARNQMEDVSAAARETLEESQEKPVDPRDIQEGLEARIQGMAGWGKILKLVNRGRDVELSISEMTLRVPVERIVDLREAVWDHFPPQASLDYVPKEESITQVDVHGLTVDEALPIVDRILNDAVMSQSPSVTIVHGHGTGTLRRAIRGYLATHPLVRSFRNGRDYEGGAGVTVVVFRDTEE
ncbi:MAG TPA: endonuclease MutS2 [bacterium]|nr:endonuclease MutS2 [bacterium]